MYDRYNRNINYLRISVTDRCNLRCTYCMPQEGIKLLHHGEILTYSEIRDFTQVAVSNGIRKVRITGGEPLVRKGITDLVAMISALDGIDDLSMTTNGTLLKNYASELRNAGLRRINISLDTVDHEKYTALTRGGKLSDVFDGIEAAGKAGLDPIKINCVVERSGKEEDAVAVEQFCRKNNLGIRYITRMDLVRGHFSVVEGGTGGACSKCNRLRLTANGRLKPCLFSNIDYDIRSLGFENALMQAIGSKPERGSTNDYDSFYNIGG